MSNKIIATLTDKGLSLVIDGEPKTINKSHKNFEPILQALRDEDDDKVRELIDVGKRISELSEGHIKVEHGVVTYKDIELHNTITERLLQTITLGLDARPLARFLNRLMKNPSNHSVKQLYSFMEACDLPITEDGRLLAYRSVRADFLDKHTGETCYSYPPNALETDEVQEHIDEVFKEIPNGYEYVHNGVTTTIMFGDPLDRCVVEMERSLVDDDHNRTCSAGLHVCSQKYGMYGDYLLLVAVDPADVVSVPNEYKQAKMRVCKYEVIKDVAKEGFRTFEDEPIYQDDDLDWDFYDNDDDFEDEFFSDF